MYDAYGAPSFNGCGLKTIAVEADTGVEGWLGICPLDLAVSTWLCLQLGRVTAAFAEDASVFARSAGSHR